MKKVKAKIKVLSYQKKFIDSKDSKYLLFLGGFGAGKTETGILRTLYFCSYFGKKYKEEKIGTYVFGIYEPTYDLIKVILFDRFEEIMNKYGLKYTLNKSDKTLYIHDFNSKIIFRSLENEDKIIGYEHADFWIDELDTLKKDKAGRVWKKILGRNRLKKYKINIKDEVENRKNTEISEFNFEKDNSGFVTTTPEGYEFCYDTFENISEELKKKFKTIRGKTLDNIFIDKSYVMDLISQYPENLQKAYLDAEYVNLFGNNVYSMFNRLKNNINLEIDEYFEDSNDNRELHIGMDFNVDHMSACVSIWNRKDEEIYILEELKDILDTPKMIEVIKEKYEKNGYKIYIYPDSSGKNRKSNNASISDIFLLQQAGFKVIFDSTNPFIKDRVMSVNGALKNGNGRIRLYINVLNCTSITESLEKQIYDKATGQPSKKEGLDHIIDAVGYLVYKIFPIKKQLFIKDK